MVAIRIIPCLDVKDGQVVKGVRFQGLRNMGDPAEIAARYDYEGADEICMLDVSASIEGRKTQHATVQAIAEQLTIPLTVGGGVKTPRDVEQLLKSGADKVSINSSGVDNPQLFKECSDHFGSQCIVAAIDAKADTEYGWRVYTHGGATPTQLNALEWAQQCCDLGAGELLVTSMDADGTRDGYDNKLLSQLSRLTNVPMIASGGAGKLEHLVSGVLEGEADALLAASIFHLQEVTISEVKQYLASQGIPVRLLAE